MAKTRTYIIRRAVYQTLTIFGLLFLIFFISHVLPTDPAAIWAGGTARLTTAGFKQRMDILNERYHLNEPIYVQFWYYLVRLSKGDLGISPMTNNPVTVDLFNYLPHTIELAVTAFIFALAIGIPLGVISAVWKNKIIDHMVRVLSLISVSMPTFWLALMLQLLFYYKLQILPGGSRLSTSTISLYPLKSVTGFYILDSILTGNMKAFQDLMRHLALPALALGLISMAWITRVTRNSMLEVLDSEYITTARAYGFKDWIINFKFALKNALTVTVTTAGGLVGSLLAGSALVEVIFHWPGIGKYAVAAVGSMDFPALMGFTLIAGISYSMGNLVADLIYGIIDPRVRT